MKIWIDILHTPQLNFYKPIIGKLSDLGHYVCVTILGRGNLSKIAQKELSGLANVTVETIGRHRMTRWSAIVEANFLRDIQLFWWARNKHFDIAFSNGMQLAMVSHAKKIPNYAFCDDPQTWARKWKEKWNTRYHVCVYEDDSLRPPSYVLKCTKEWAYLSPKIFVPNPDVLKQYNLKPKEYLFVREVSVGTINYSGQQSNAVLGIIDFIPKNMKVLLSLEEKHRRDEYPQDWIILKEPVNDIHSLIYYSAGLISSGDSMAREGALLGVPSYYLGIRYSMPSNLAVTKVASLQNSQTMKFEDWITSLPDDSVQLETRQAELRKHIDKEFFDVNAYMLQLVESVEQKNK